LKATIRRRRSPATGVRPCARRPDPLTAPLPIASPETEPAVMKSEGHPDYHFITVQMTDGTTYRTRSTYGKEGANLALDIDSKSHPAWTGGGQQLMDRAGRMSRFNDKFGAFLTKKK
jgi:large subunit ribosomal protein L31